MNDDPDNIEDLRFIFQTDDTASECEASALIVLVIGGRSGRQSGYKYSQRSIQRGSSITGMVLNVWTWTQSSGCAGKYRTPPELLSPRTDIENWPDESKNVHEEAFPFCFFGPFFPEGGTMSVPSKSFQSY